jgi:hypothetical protein
VIGFALRVAQRGRQIFEKICLGLCPEPRHISKEKKIGDCLSATVGSI